MEENTNKKIKRQTKNTIEYYKILDNIEEVPIDILRSMYKDILSELKRVKELYEDLKIKNNFRIVGKYGEVKLEELLKNDFIPKQKVKKLIKNETINISGFECIAVEDIEELLEESK